MKRSNILSLSLLVTISIFLSGCYTQFSSFDKYSSDSDRNSKYYSWNDDELSEAGYYWDDEEQTAKPYSYSSEIEDDEYLTAEETGLYYKDYEVEQWYKDNNFEGVYWNGYDEGFEDGYQEGYDDGYNDDFWFRGRYYAHLGYNWYPPFRSHVSYAWYYDVPYRYNSHFYGYGGWNDFYLQFGYGARFDPY
ncbi:MAG: hypothetical protein ABJG33_12540, partial [Balneola sp.]